MLTYLYAFELVVFMLREPLLTIISIVHDHNAFSSLHVHILVTSIVWRVILTFPLDDHKRMFAYVRGKSVNARIEHCSGRVCWCVDVDVYGRGGM
jgi:hypothetical protein